MEASLNRIQNNLHLEQSKLYGDFYESISIEKINTFNDISIKDIDDWFNSILNKYRINEEQLIGLQLFMRSLKYVLKNIDPKKLNVENCIVDEDNIMLWRESKLGISKLVFDIYGQITYIYNGNDGQKVNGVFDSEVDMEKLLFRFISK